MPWQPVPRLIVPLVFTDAEPEVLGSDSALCYRRSDAPGIPMSAATAALFRMNDLQIDPYFPFLWSDFRRAGARSWLLMGDRSPTARCTGLLEVAALVDPAAEPQQVLGA